LDHAPTGTPLGVEADAQMDPTGPVHELKDTNIKCYRGKVPNLGCCDIYMEVFQRRGNYADPEDVISARIHQT